MHRAPDDRARCRLNHLHAAGVVAALVATATLAGCTADGTVAGTADSPVTAVLHPSGGPGSASPAGTGDTSAAEAAAQSPSPLPEAAVADVDVADARAALAALPVKGRAPKTGYSRDLFGPAWTDDVPVAGGHNGCDTRNDILRRDLTGIDYRPGTGGCVVASGVLDDPYTGHRIDFTRGRGTSRAVQIDHVVALMDAWQKGAQQLPPQRRRSLANDPLNLLAVDGRANEQKRAGDAATWLPANKRFRCSYVIRQVRVKTEYHLWVTAAERDAIDRVLGRCTGVEASAPPANVPALPAETTAPPATPPASDGGEVYFRNCAAARAAGAAPLHAGDPGYRAGLDGDGDGVACE